MRPTDLAYLKACKHTLLQSATKAARRGVSQAAWVKFAESRWPNAERVIGKRTLRAIQDYVWGD